MSRIPNCREGEIYNQKYLNEKDRAEVIGYDWCTEEVVDNFFTNLDDIIEQDSYFGHILYEKLPEDMQEEYTMLSSFNADTHFFGETTEEHRRCENYADLLQLRLLEWIEKERNEMITSMLDNMSDEEYESIKARVDGGSK